MAGIRSHLSHEAEHHMSPEPAGSITRLIERLRGADAAASRALWERFCERMLALAKARLGAGSRRVADEEDVVVVAFERFLRGVREGRFPRLNDREDLWAVLLTLTTNQAIDQARAQGRLKRGGDVRGDSAFGKLDPAAEGPTPEEAAEVQETMSRLLAALKDDELRQIALGKMEGCANAEIAASIGRSVVTVERRLKLIRETWKKTGLVENV